MNATSFSKRPYYPFALANGNDTVLLNYTGAMVSGVTGHTHNEQHQAGVCAWYKAEHRRNSSRLKPIVSFGYQVEINGEVREPLDYDQRFDASTATLTTRVTFALGTVIDIQAFLSDSSVLVMAFSVISCNASDIFLTPMIYVPGAVPCGMLLEENTVLEETADGVDFTYNIDENCGRGVLRTDRKGWSHKQYNKGTRLIGMRYSNISPGWKMTAYVSCADDPLLPCTDFTGFREAHLKRWSDYYGTSSVKLPDDELQYAYELSRYVVASMLHRGGALPVGHLPSLWNGGTCCPYDSEMMQLALLQGNNLQDGRHHVDFYLGYFDEGVELAKAVGLKGFAFSNWSDVLGNHKSSDIKRELTYRKAPMIGLMGIAAANAELYSGKKDPQLEKLAEACADFIECFIRDGNKIVSCVAGNESDIEVERDTFMLMVIIRLFEMTEMLFNDSRHGAIARELRKELLLNRRQDGIIMPFANATYTAGMTTHVQYYLPDLVSEEDLDKSLFNVDSPSRMDFDQPSEVYRHWPWIDCHYARAYAFAGSPAKAFMYLTHWFDYAAATGASPEKIRLDGFPIGYWYPTPYALYLQALYASFAHIDAQGRLKVLYGFDGTWKDLEATSLRLPGGLNVSVSVQGGKMERLDIIGGNDTLQVLVNPIYQ
ncbi:MAG: hypothetical protein J6X55_13185 [Victivallales bacterium]|nr:hypothetical protein [Victivallales bacterium]